MDRIKKGPKIAALVLLSVVFGLIGIGKLKGSSDRIYSVLEKAFYLSAQDAVWIRPGLKLEILNVTIPADRRPVVTFKITDDAGNPLDRTGGVTPGVVSTSFVLG